MNNYHFNYDPSRLRFTGVVGTGGIGSGRFFVLNGNHTLGREESRGGHFLEIRDYCKQHIILYYIKKLMGPEFSVIPIGKLGDDEQGHLLYDEMTSDGFIMKRIEKVPSAATLFSFCFFYPDGSGGNLTTDNSASSLVNSETIEKAESDIQLQGPGGIVMAAPEVPLEARIRLIELGKKYGAFRAASFTSGEIDYVLKSNIIKSIDLLSMNIDEAEAAAGIKSGKESAENIVSESVRRLNELNGSLKIAITSGKDGSWCWDGESLNNFPAARVNAVSTAGAGDAFLAGLLCGFSLGFDMFAAQQLATLIAGFSINSPHTINRDINRHSLNHFIGLSGLNVSLSIQNLLSEQSS